jgi:hypothetical protein
MQGVWILGTIYAYARCARRAGLPTYTCFPDFSPDNASSDYSVTRMLASFA